MHSSSDLSHTSSFNPSKSTSSFLYIIWWNWNKLIWEKLINWNSSWSIEMENKLFKELSSYLGSTNRIKLWHTPTKIQPKYLQTSTWRFTLKSVAKCLPPWAWDKRRERKRRVTRKIDANFGFMAGRVDLFSSLIHLVWFGLVADTKGQLRSVSVFWFYKELSCLMWLLTFSDSTIFL